MSKNTRYWVIGDTHLGHTGMAEYCGRPDGFSEKILRNINNTMLSGDVLIHLGDVCIGRDDYWCTQLFEHCNGPLWLVRGNHDKKSTSWYLNRGFDWVGDEMALNMFGRELAFSHCPLDDTHGRMNIHGHLHNTGHHFSPKSPLHRLLYIEHGYTPVNLRRIAESTPESWDKFLLRVNGA